MCGRISSVVGGDGHVDLDSSAAVDDLLEKIDITEDVGTSSLHYKFRTTPRENLQQAAGKVKLSFDGLIRVGHAAHVR